MNVHRSGCFALALALVGSASCAEPLAVVTDSPTPAAVKLTQLADAFEARYTTPERTGRSEISRQKLVGAALIPSRVFDDTTIWSTIVPPATRTLTTRAALTDHGYRFDYAADRSAPAKPGDMRRSVALTRLAPNEFRWETGVEFAIGSLTADDVGNMFAELFTGAHDRDPTTLRTAAHMGFPRATATLGKVFSLDSLITRPGAQGTTTITLVIGVRTDELRKTDPHFADYIAKYVEASHYRFSLADRNGALFFEAVGGDRRLTIQYRVKAGTIVSYLGPPRALPDSLRLTSDFSIHVKPFQAGWKNLVTDFIIERGEHSRGWKLVAQTEPDWQLPLITERLLRSPLHRPFEGAGASYELAVVDSAGAQSLFVRHAHLEVRESKTLRFLGGLVAHVLNDLDAQVEREEAAYFRELVVGFAADTKAFRLK